MTTARSLLPLQRLSLGVAPTHRLLTKVMIFFPENELIEFNLRYRLKSTYENYENFNILVTCVLLFSSVTVLAENE